MREVRSYSNVWKVERMLYGVNDYHLPRPVPQSIAITFAVFFVLSIFLKGYPPFVFGSSFVTNSLGVPVLLTWLVNKLKPDGKTPVGFVYSWFRYMVMDKNIVRGKVAVVEDYMYCDTCITIGRERKG